MEKALIDKLSRLTKSDKLILVEALWDSIASDPEKVEVPDHHKEIIEERLKTLKQDKESGSSWEEVQNSGNQECSSRNTENTETLITGKNL